MAHLRLYLWKEWRDQRNVVFGVLFALPVLLGVSTWIGGTQLCTSPMLPPVTAAVGIAITTLTLGMDLLAGEIRRRRVAFLERLPAGLATAFAAKLTLFLASVVGAACYGYALGVGLVAWRGGDSAALPWDQLLTRYVVPGTGLVLWAFAVSAWIPRSALALPGTALAIGVLAWPVWLFYRPSELVAPTAWEAWAFLALSLVGAPLVAGLSFVRGYRFGARPRRYAAIGLAAACAALSPAWAWTGVRFHHAHTIDPDDSSFRMPMGFVGAGGRFAFLTTYRAQRPPVGRRAPPTRVHALLVDLQTGEWSEPGKIDASWSPIGSSAIAPESVWLHDNSHARLFDGRTGMPVGSTREPDDVQRQVAVDLGLGEDYRVQRRAGLGYRVYRRKGRHLHSVGYFDPRTQRHLSREQIFALHFARLCLPFPYRPQFLGRLYSAFEDTRYPRICIRPGEWLIELRGWWLLDPDTLDLTPVESLVSGEDRLGPALPDGRFLLASNGRAWLYDPEEGSREPVELIGDWTGHVNSLYDVTYGQPIAGIHESGYPLVVSVGGSHVSGLARFDAERRTLELATVSPWRDHFFLGWSADGESILVSERDQRIVQHWFGEDRSEVLFPRD